MLFLLSLDGDYAADFFFGTFAPERRASDRPMAIACFRLFTFFPLRPLFNVPLFIAFISRSTDLPAFGLYLRPEDFFLAVDLFAEVLLRFADFLAPVERPRVDFLVAAICESSLLDSSFYQ